MSKKKLEFNWGKAIMFTLVAFGFSVGHMAKASAKGGDPNHGVLVLILAGVFVVMGFLDSFIGE